MRVSGTFWGLAPRMLAEGVLSVPTSPELQRDTQEESTPSMDIPEQQSLHARVIFCMQRETGMTDKTWVKGETKLDK